MSTAAVEVEQLEFTYPGRDQPALADVSFALPAGSWTVLAGRTGTGKSTMLRALAGLIPHHSAGMMRGTVKLFGRDTRTASVGERAELVGLVLQSPDDQICTTSVEAEVAFGPENLALPPDEIEARLAESLRQVDLEGFADRRTQQLSGGQKQRLVLASALAMRPRLLLLDEPLSQLDPAAAADLLTLLDQLRDQGMTIVVVEHRLDDVLSRADQVLLFDVVESAADDARTGRLAGQFATDDEDRLRAAFMELDLPLPEITRLSLALGCGAARTVDELVGRVATNGERRDRQAATSVRSPTAARSPSVLRADDVTFRWRDSPTAAVESVSFDIGAGECIAVLGPNGAGKSTLLRLAAGLLHPQRGTIVPPEVNGTRAATGLVPQNPDLALFCNTVRDELAFAPLQRRLASSDVEATLHRAAELFGLTHLLDEPPLGLSQGQRLRVAVAAAWTLRPRLLLLDEPTTGQDPEQIEAVMRAVAAALDEVEPLTVLFTTHDLRVVGRYATRALVLSAGRLLADATPDELMADDQLLDAARLRRPPLFEIRHRLGWQGTTVDELAREAIQ